MPDEIVEEKETTITENIRYLMRPFLTIFFSLLFGFVVCYSIYNDHATIKDMLLAVDGILGTVIGYHFGKASTLDKKPNG